MSVYRKGYTDRKGRATQTKAFTIEFRDHIGQIRRVYPGIENRNLARAFELKVRLLVDLRRSLEPVPDLLKQWIEGIAPDLRDKLAEWDIIAGGRIRAMQPVSVMLDAWKDSLCTSRTCPQSLEGVYRNAKQVLAHAGATFWRDVDADKVAQACFALGRSTQTKKHKWAAVTQACRWIAECHLKLGIGSSPLARARPRFKPTVEDEKYNHPRRALCAEEIAALLEATAKGRPIGRGTHRVSGPVRRLMYWVAIETGLRLNEISTITRAAFNLANAPFTVSARATRTKNGKARTIPIRPELANELREYFQDSMYAPNTPVFPKFRNAARAMQIDLKAAGIAYHDPETKDYVDFHSLRHTFITSVLKKTDIKTASQLAGHSNITTTGRYLHTNTMEQVRAIMAMPNYATSTARHDPPDDGQVA